MKIIVGLGNPGKQYEKTRHNIGFMAIDAYAKKYNLNAKEKFNGVFYEKIINNEKYIYLKPQNYMNLSGGVVKKFADFYKISINDIYIICDDLDMPVAKIRLRSMGSSGGHNGLKDIEKNFQTNMYKRIKVGISNDKTRETKNYVLGTFSKDEINLINNSIEDIVDILDSIPSTEFLNLMNRYN